MKGQFSFWKRKPKGQPASLDDKVRLALAKEGDDGSKPRHTLLYFYGGDVDGLSAAALAAGYEVNPTEARVGLILEKTVAVDEDGFNSIAVQMGKWAQEFEAEYDGWECEVLV
jgi:hypothetical protein